MGVIALDLDTRAIEVCDQSQIAGARRVAGAIARTLGFDEVHCGQVEIVASELATNLWLHARGGSLLMRSHGLIDGIELIAVDHGLGMANIDVCLRDGFSTAGTLGHGLGAIRRLSQVFDIYSQPKVGTVVLAQLLRTLPARTRLQSGGLCIALANEPVCGDAWQVSHTASGARICIADGLGHGPDAAEAAQAAMRGLAANAGRTPAATIEGLHDVLSGSRGAAIAVCDIDVDRQLVRFSGVGNIGAAIVREGTQRGMMSHNGIVGHQMREAREFTYPWSDDSLLVMYSDGLQSRWTLDDSPGLAARHPSVIAAALHRDFTRDRDDACVVVVRKGPA